MGLSSIEWTTRIVNGWTIPGFTFNGWIGCEKVSAGCKNCYASVDTYARVSKSRGLPLWGPRSSRHRTSEAYWKQPLRWAKLARQASQILGFEVRPFVFAHSLSDVFEDRPELVAWREELFDLIELCPELDWLLLTKRPENVRRMVPTSWLIDGGWPIHVWLGATVENQEQAQARIPKLWDVKPTQRFGSFEPLLGKVSTDLFAPWDYAPLDWYIIGGESGPDARPCDIDWIRGLVHQGRAVNAAVFVKQLGAKPSYDTDGPGGTPAIDLVDRKGGDPSEWPVDLRIQETPQ